MRTRSGLVASFSSVLCCHSLLIVIRLNLSSISGSRELGSNIKPKVSRVTEINRDNREPEKREKRQKTERKKYNETNNAIKIVEATLVLNEPRSGKQTFVTFMS